MIKMLSTSPKALQHHLAAGTGYYITSLEDCWQKPGRKEPGPDLRIQTSKCNCRACFEGVTQSVCESCRCAPGLGRSMAPKPVPKPAPRVPALGQKLDPLLETVESDARARGRTASACRAQPLALPKKAKAGTLIMIESMADDGPSRSRFRAAVATREVWPTMEQEELAGCREEV